MAKVKRVIEDYDDIISLPHHVSTIKKQMSIDNRAAQFSPFSAVVGYDKAVKEAGRHTQTRKELDETQKALIDNQLREIDLLPSEERHIEVTYYEPDDTKSGGSYVTIQGHVKKFDVYEKKIVFFDQTPVVINDIYAINLIKDQ